MAKGSRKGKRGFMQTGFRAFLMAAGAFGMAMPALAQPANPLRRLSSQPPQPVTFTHQPFLAAAHEDVENHHWNAAGEALEQSETFLLNGGVVSSGGIVTSPSPAMPYVIQARIAVKQRDQVDALVAIDKAVSAMSLAPVASPPVTIATAKMPVATFATASGTTEGQSDSAAPLPLVTKALLPGHWQLVGWQYHWVPQDTSYRYVQSNPFVPGHYEYRGGAWMWVAGHYAGTQD
jgi:hypothetical protein